ncbi:MAG: hypothetical protein WCB94_07655 [Terriglobales bacterium]
MPTHLAESHRAAQGLPDQPALTLKRKPKLGFLAERFGPLLIGIVAAASVTRIPVLWLLGAAWKESLFEKVFELEIGLLAGLLAIVAFLPAIEEKTVIRKFKQWGYYRYVVSYLREAIWTSGLAMLLTLAITVLPDQWKVRSHLNLVISAAWWGFFSYSIAAAFRIVKLALKSLLAN